MTYEYEEERKPSRHDHVGFMRFTDKECWCTECGQRWWLGRVGWVPVTR